MKNLDELKLKNESKEILNTSLELCKESVLFETQETMNTTIAKQVLKNYFNSKSKR